MSKILLDYDPLKQTKEVFHHSDGDKEFGIHTVQDVGPIIRENKALQNADRKNPRGEVRRMAQIPLVTWLELANQKIVSPDGTRILDEKKFRRWLNDPENSAFRTRLGKV